MTAGASDPHVGLVVEGRGDSSAVPMLLRAHLYRNDEYREIVGKPIPVNGKGAVTTPGGIERFVATAALRPGCRAVLVILDADREPTCEEGPRLLARAQAEVAVPVLVALAERDYEDWLYCSVETIGLGDAEWERGRNGGAEIKRLLAPKAYVKPTWQPKLTARLDLDLAAGRSVSLQRLLDRFDVLRAGI